MRFVVMTIAVLAAVAGIVLFVFWGVSEKPHAAPRDATGSAVAARPAEGSSAAPAKPAAAPHVKKLTADERKRVADRIAAAHASHSIASTSTPAPKLPESPGDAPPAISKESIRDAMREVVEQLAGCYEAALPKLDRKDFGIKAEMTLTGDPDVGTLIDAKQLFDDRGKPLPPELDDCLRNTFQTLELPPLTEGDQVTVIYPFQFSHGD
jgi:hypothetical protein